MFEVVNGVGGTATRAKINFNGIKIGGKTGTTQVRRISLKERAEGIKKDEDLPWKYRNHAWFMAYAPLRNPSMRLPSSSNTAVRQRRCRPHRLQNLEEALA